MLRLQEEAALGLQLVEVPEEDVVARLIPFFFDPLEEGVGALPFFFAGGRLDQGGAGPDEEAGVGELVHLLFQGLVLELVVFQSFFFGAHIGTAGVLLDFADRVAVLPGDELVFRLVEECT